MTATYITTTIPYVNARPHIGHALELVQADVLARYHRGRGDPVRFQAGTDDNALKNVLAAGTAGLGVREFVDRNAEAFVALGGALSLSVDDFIRTGPASRRSGGPALLTCTGSSTPACTAPAVSSSTVRPSCATAAAPNTGPNPSRSARRTGSSGCPGTPRRCGRRSPPAGCGSSPPGAATRCSGSSTAGWRTSPCHGPPTGPAAGASRCPATRPRSSTSGSTHCATT
jgi:tRNA synthetases class I (M)